mmetsp:Transcript_18140/g.68752  ORF Transcript_18140/g.68752 Transcript_18140/m.68752 type:complete len:187 (+) Transcript_18140:118-678(+)
MRRRTAPAESGGDSAGPLQLKSVLNSVQNGVAGVLAGLQQDIGLPKEEEWKIRSWEEFFASFKSPTNLEERVRTNLLYYKANYVYVILPTACVVPLLMSPIGLVLLLAGASVAFWTISNHEFSGSQERQAMKAAIVLIGVLFVFSGSILLLLYGLSLGILACAAHAVFRARSMYSRISTYDARKSM